MAATDGARDNRGMVQKLHKRVIMVDWWEKIDSEEHDASGQFYRTFRMTRIRFNLLLNYIKNKWVSVFGKHSLVCLKRQKGNAIRKKLAIALHFFSMESGVRPTAQQFGVSVASVWLTVKHISRVILKNKLDFIYKRTDFEVIADEFEKIAGFPNVYAAVDGSHILRNRPENFTGWYNRKGVPSYNIQGVVDAKCRFMSLSIRHGCCSDKKLWNDSNFGRKIQDFLPWDKHVLGDSIYTLRPWLLTPYSHETSDRTERRYNYRHSCTRIVVERAFGILKGRWRCLKHLKSHDKDTGADIIETCVCLHNFCSEVEDMNGTSEWMHQDSLLSSRVCDPSTEHALALGEQKRNCLKVYLNSLPTNRNT